MYSKSAWGGPVDPFILLKFLPYTGDDDPVVSLVIFEWKDEDLIGVYPSADATQKIGICEPEFVEAGFCEEQNIGEFILADNATAASKNLILTDAIHLKNAQPIKYDINKTGYYCVLAEPYTAGEYTAVVEFRNAYGELPATQIPKLPFYGGISILYALVAVFWGFLYYRHHADICMLPAYHGPVQPYADFIFPSGCAKLHNGNLDFPGRRDADDLGLLRLVYLSWRHCYIADLMPRKSEPTRFQRWLQGLPGRGWRFERGQKLILFLLAAYCVHGVWSRKAHPRPHHDLRAMARHSALRLRSGLCDHKSPDNSRCCR